MRGWRDYVAGAPDEVTSTVVTITMPAAPDLPEVVHNRACVIVAGVYAGDPGHWADPAADADTIGWVRSTWERLTPHGTGGVYLNFTGLADEPMRAGVDDAFGRNLRRLAEIKATYDRDNFFRYNNNIAPAGHSAS